MSGHDPSIHRQEERRFIEHVERVLADERLKIDTLRGRRAVQSAIRKNDRAVDLKRLMIDLGKSDRELQSKMPLGESLEVELKRKRLFIIPTTIGRLRAVCISPTRALLEGASAGPLSKGAVEEMINHHAPAAERAPITLLILATGGFAPEAQALAEKRDGRTVVLVEPNAVGGFVIHAPPGFDKELFDPEAEEDKRRRIRAAIDDRRMEFSASGVAADQLALKTQLPAQIVEAELKSYAKENPGLAARRLDGRLVLFREGSAVVNLPPAGGLSSMPMIDRIRALFARRGETEKKIAFLAERRAALGQQRDRAYEEIGSLESKDGELREQFKNAGPELTKRRITSQLLQLRKDIERRQQLLNVLNQQINVVSTHLHNLELVQQGETAKLPDSEAMASDAAAAEEMLATLQESSEMAESVGGVAASSMSAEEQTLYEELLRETGAPAEIRKEPGEGEAAAGQRIAPPNMPTAERTPQKRKNEAEPG